jgi:hypothetical protein
MERAPYSVIGTDTYVEAWSTTRLQFEPKGWLLEYRSDLRRALRSMRATRTGILYAEYATPDQSFADLENVLLYNLGSGCYAHLARRGIVCRRTSSADDLHRVSYVSMEPSDVAAPTGQVLAAARLAEVPGGSTAAHWWSAFREQLKMQGPAGALHEGEFGIRAEFGSVWSHRELAPAIKSLLDGFIAALHVHDGSGRDHVTAALNAVGDGECLWNLLNESEIAILGGRRLVRPHGSKLAWNPADERCGFFELTRTTQHDALTVTIYALAQ